MSTTSNVIREYLETIYNLAVEGDPIVGARLAEKFGVSAPNVAAVLKRMERDGFIVMPGRGRGRAGEGIELTDQGRAEAEAMLRQHRLAERFLSDTLGMDWVQAHEEAHHLERGMSPAIEERLMALLNNPRTCPHGNPIPTKSVDTVEYLRRQRALRLSDAEERQPMKVVLISEIVEDESALLTYLGQIDVMPGALITVEGRVPDERSLNVSITPRGRTPGEAPAHDRTRAITLSHDLAAKIWVASARQ
jgi:DtxR family Mn-dependent transcriptional regulator